MIPLRLIVFLALSLVLPDAAQAQGTRCRTAPVGTSSDSCASEAFVTQSVAGAGNVTGPASSTAGHMATFADTTGKVIQDGGTGGTVTEQKNTVGYGLTSSGNCDNTSTNAASPCNAAVNLSSLTNSLSGTVALNNTANFFDGPTVAQGVTGTWFASGTVTINDAGTTTGVVCKLWDGTTIIAAGFVTVPSVNNPQSLTLSGILSAPTGNIKISCRDPSTTTGQILNIVASTANASTLTAVRIQ